MLAYLRALELSSNGGTMNIPLIPLYDRLLVRRKEAQEQSDGGIYIPDTVRERPAEGEVLVVGEGRYNAYYGRTIPLTVKVGDYILFGKYAGSEITYDDETYTLLAEDEVLAIIRKETVK